MKRKDEKTNVEKLLEKGIDRESIAAMACHTTDTGNGKRLALHYGDKLRYLWDTRQWLYYDGQRWSKESGQEGVSRLCKQTAEKMYDEIKMMNDSDAKLKTARWAIKSESSFGAVAMAQMARSEKPISTYSKYFDTDPMQFNAWNFVINLNNGSVTPQHPEYNITKMAGCEFDEKATCPTWERCVDEWMEGDKEKIEYLQTILGYCLTGDTSARVFPIFHGHGFNGKSKCLDTLLEILGDYGTLGDENLLAEKKYSSHPTDIMKLQGKRLVVVDESKENMRLRTSLVKRMTGDTTLTGRLMRQDFQDFNITHKLILMTQHLPVITETADAIWDRVHLLRWGKQFDIDERDEKLPSKLRKEYPGILNWLIKGCLKWQEAGCKIKRPVSVQEAGIEYRAESDPLGDFIEAKCELNPRCTTPVKVIKEAYQNWCQNENVKWVESKQSFNNYLREKACEQKNVKISGKAVKCWTGIGLSDD